jgi:hypothetical protein
MIDPLGQPALSGPADQTVESPSAEISAPAEQPQTAPLEATPRGPARALENLLAHAPRDLLRHGEKHLGKLMDRLGFRARQLAGVDQAALSATRVQLDFAYQAVRRIDQAGNETFAMQLSLQASMTSLAVDDQGLSGQVRTFSAEAFLASGQDAQALFNQTFNPPTTAESVVNHAADRYRQMLEARQAEDSLENRTRFADRVGQAVDSAAESLAQKYAGNPEALARLEETHQAIAEKLSQFVSGGLSDQAPASPAALAQQQMWLQIEATATQFRSYRPDAVLEADDPDDAQPEQLDVAA